MLKGLFGGSKTKPETDSDIANDMLASHSQAYLEEAIRIIKEQPENRKEVLIKKMGLAKVHKSGRHANKKVLNSIKNTILEAVDAKKGEAMGENDIKAVTSTVVESAKRFAKEDFDKANK